MMTAISIPVLLATIVLAASPAQWTPFRFYLGSWDGKRQGSDGQVSVVRQYESVVRNQHLLVTERVSDKREPWGVVSFDGPSGGFVLRRFQPDGSVVELVLEPAPKESGALVFNDAGAGSGGSVRVTQEMRGANEFVEKVELATDGKPMVVVSETVFRRKS